MLMKRISFIFLIIILLLSGCASHNTEENNKIIDNPEYNFVMGNAYYKQENWTGAIEYFLKNRENDTFLAAIK